MHMHSRYFDLPPLPLPRGGGLAGLGFLGELATPDPDVEAIMEGVETGKIHPSVHLHLQLELGKDAQKRRRGENERVRIVANLRRLPGMVDPGADGAPGGISGHVHWEIYLPAGELWNLTSIPDLRRIRVAPGIDPGQYHDPQAIRNLDYAPLDEAGLRYPWLNTVGFSDPNTPVDPEETSRGDGGARQPRGSTRRPRTGRPDTRRPDERDRFDDEERGAPATRDGQPQRQSAGVFGVSGVSIPVMVGALTLGVVGIWAANRLGNP